MARLFLTLLSIVSLAVGVTACGASKDSTSPKSSSTATAEPIVTVSRELGPIDADDYGLFNFGHAANAKERSELVAMTRRYYTIAAAEQGAKACSMLYVATATEVVAEQDDWGVRGKTCTVVMSRIFQKRHQRILAAQNSLKVVLVRTDKVNAFIILRIANSPIAREFSARRVGSAWKVTQPLDSPTR